MSETDGPEKRPGSAGDEPSGPNLTLAFSLIAVALAAAICIALFIVLPFYHHR
jgi:hypothetical protein